MFKEIVDLSNDIFDGMTCYGSPKTTFWKWYSHAETSKKFEGRVSMEGHCFFATEHLGTHLDAPYHFNPNGKKIAEIPIEEVILPGHVVDMSQKGVWEAISGEDLEAGCLEAGFRVQPGDAILVYTGWGEKFEVPERAVPRPYLDGTAADWVLDRGLRLIGVDLVSVEALEVTPDDRPVHMKLCGSNRVYMVEMLRNLGTLLGKDFWFFAVPIKLRYGTGAPVRAFAGIL